MLDIWGGFYGIFKSYFYLLLGLVALPAVLPDHDRRIRPFCGHAGSVVMARSQRTQT